DKSTLVELARRAPLERAASQLVLVLALKVGLTDSQAAAALLRRAVLAQPRDFWLIFGLANVSRDPPERIGFCQAALAFRPNNVSVLNNLGWALHDNKDVEGAILCYRKACTLDNKYAMLHNNLGTTLYAKKDWDGAVASYRKALELEPEMVEALTGLGAA